MPNCTTNSFENEQNTYYLVSFCYPQRHISVWGMNFYLIMYPYCLQYPQTWLYLLTCCLHAIFLWKTPNSKLPNFPVLFVVKTRFNPHWILANMITTHCTFHLSINCHGRKGNMEWNVQNWQSEFETTHHLQGSISSGKTLISLSAVFFSGFYQKKLEKTGRNPLLV